MADYVIVTYNHESDDSTVEVFEGTLLQAELRVLDQLGDRLRSHPSWFSAPDTIVLVANEGSWRQVTLVESSGTGRSMVTFRINDRARHCRTCRCNVSAFG